MLKYLFNHEILAKQFVEITASYNIEVYLIEKNNSWQINIEKELDKLIKDTGFIEIDKKTL